MAYYYVADAPGIGVTVAGRTERISPEFTADTLGHAQTLAQIYATLFQRTVCLVPKGGAPPYAAVAPAASGSALGSAPTGISF